MSKGNCIKVISITILLSSIENVYNIFDIYIEYETHFSFIT